jgi:hypothetical protein
MPHQTTLETDNLIYFTSSGKRSCAMVPDQLLSSWVWWSCWFFYSAYLALQSKVAKLSYSFIGVASVLPGVAIMVMAAWAAAWVLWITRISLIIGGRNHDAEPYVAVCTLIGIACGTGLFMLVIRRIGAESFSIGCLLVWSVLTVLVNIYLIGASYLLLWPLVVSAAGWALVLANDRISDATRAIILGISGAAVIAIVIPLAHKIFFAFSVRSSRMVSALVGLSLSLLIGPIAADLPRKRRVPDQHDSGIASGSQWGEHSVEKTAIAI